jgi:hypothetical protein
MARHTESEPVVARRTVLAGVGSAVGALAASGSVAAQERGVTARAALPAADEYADSDLAGFFVHVDPAPDPVQAPLAEECEYANWPREETMAYEVLLIDRKDDDHFSTQTRLYIPDSRTVPEGGLYVINGVTECAGSYIGIEIEQLYANVSVVGEVSPSGDGAADDPGGGGETTATDGAGLGVLTALAGLGGAGALSRWRRDGE